MSHLGIALVIQYQYPFTSKDNTTCFSSAGEYFSAKLSAIITIIIKINHSLQYTFCLKKWLFKSYCLSTILTVILFRNPCLQEIKYDLITEY